MFDIIQVKTSFEKNVLKVTSITLLIVYKLWIYFFGGDSGRHFIIFCTNINPQLRFIDLLDTVITPYKNIVITTLSKAGLVYTKLPNTLEQFQISLTYTYLLIVEDFESFTFD